MAHQRPLPAPYRLGKVLPHDQFEEDMHVIIELYTNPPEDNQRKRAVVGEPKCEMPRVPIKDSISAAFISHKILTG